MRVVYEAGHLIDAYLVRHALEDAGIPAFVRGEALLGGLGQLPVCGMVAVSVPDSRFPDACMIVGSMPLVQGEAAAIAFHGHVLPA